MGIKHHVVDFCVAVADTFRKFSLSVQAFGESHFLGAAFNFVYKVFHAFCSPRQVVFHSVAELLQAEFHVVEVFDCLTKFHGNVGKHGFEISECLAHGVGAFWGNGFFGYGIWNIDHNAPIFPGFKQIVFIVFVFLRNETQAFALDVGFAGLGEFLADMIGYGNDVAHKQVDIGENCVVDALQHVVGRVVLCGNFVGRVD